MKVESAARREVSSAFPANVTTDARLGAAGATARARNEPVLPTKAGRATTAEAAEVMAAIVSTRVCANMAGRRIDRQHSPMASDRTQSGFRENPASFGLVQKRGENLVWDFDSSRVGRIRLFACGLYFFLTPSTPFVTRVRCLESLARSASRFYSLWLRRTISRLSPVLLPFANRKPTENAPFSVGSCRVTTCTRPSA